MLGFLVFSPQNDLLYMYTNEAFRRHIQELTGNLGLAPLLSSLELTDSDHNEQCHPDVVIQIFSPFIASQTIMDEQFHNPYVLVVCENGIQVSVKQYLGFIVIAVCSSENLHASHLATVGCSFLKRVCGPLPSLLKFSASHAHLVTSLLSVWQQMRESDLSMVTESLNYLELGEQTMATIFKSLRVAVQMLSLVTKIPLSCFHVIVYSRNDLVAVYSGKGSIQLSVEDLLFLKVLTGTISSSTSLHSQLVLLDSYIPCTAHLQNITPDLTVVILVENGLAQLSRYLHDSLILLQRSLSSEERTVELNKLCKSIQNSIKSTKFDLKEPLVYKDTPNCDSALSRKVLDIFKKICLDPNALFLTASHVPKIMDSLKASLSFDRMENLAKNSFSKVLEQYDGLVHFIFIDRRKDAHRMVAPTLPPVGHNQTSDAVWKMFYISMQWLFEGQLQLLWNDKELCYSHFLWMENDNGGKVPWTNVTDLQNGSLGYPGVVGTNFYEKLMELNSSSNLNYYQLFCVHLGVTSPADVLEQSRNLAVHLTKYFLPGAVQDLL